MQAKTFIPPEQLAAISNLELIARTVVDGLGAGLHKSPQTGSSIEFAQYRPYAQGDEIRFLDWKLFGRTDRLFLKQFQEETNLTCTLLLDCSASMGFGSGPVSKFRYAQLLTAALATIHQRQGDRFGLVAFHKEVSTYLPPRGDRAALRRVLVALEELKPSESTETQNALQFLGDILKPRGMVILISDLLHPLDGALEHLRSLRARRHDVMVLQISDPAERDFRFDRAVTLVDMEGTEEQFVVPEAVRKGYLENRHRHFSAIRQSCLASEIDIAEFSCDQPLDFVLRHFLRHRQGGLKTKGFNSSRSGGGT